MRQRLSKELSLLRVRLEGLLKRDGKMLRIYLSYVTKKRLEGKHILIVDDIVTTGASINSCVREISKVKGIEISVIALGLAE